MPPKRRILTADEIKLAEEAAAAVQRKTALQEELGQVRRRISKATQAINKLGPLRAPVVWAEALSLMKAAKKKA